VKRPCQAEVVVLGAGPVGLVAALELSKDHPTTLVARRLPSSEDAPRVEAVPASLLALLVEFGIHPQQIGVEVLHESRRIAWEEETMVESRGPVAAHVERPVLDLALLKLVVACRRVNIVLSDHREGFKAVLEAAKRNDLRLIDATGRRSVSARTRVQPSRPWAARTFLALTRYCRADPKVRIAALPGGFVYRLGSSSHIVLGIVGRNKTIVGDPLGLEQQLLEGGAGWILEGLPAMADLIPGKFSAASVQWTSYGTGWRVGDAALARDTLSSQGLAAGISDALYYAAAVRNDDDATLLSLRQVEQRAAHLRSLEQLITRCRFQKEETWSEYAKFVAHQVDPEPAESRVALRAGRLTLG
jgi:2-polyprenyl-6-methoxyphenol hydroxylase-like FAD-dependent oxidoreductase